MTTPTEPSPFDDQKKQRFCTVLLIGCDRETACNYVGVTARDLNRELNFDPEFKKEVLRAEASPEFNQMRNVYNACKDEKNWRASVWWLERNAPERYARRSPAELKAVQKQQVVKELVEVILSELDDKEDQQRLVARLTQFAEQVPGKTTEPMPVGDPEYH